MKKKLSYTFVLLPILSASMFLTVHFQTSHTVQNNPTPKIENTFSSLKIEPSKLIFLLQYIGIDYGGAVENNAVIDQSEYEEMLDFSDTVVDWYKKLLPDNKNTITFSELIKLQSMVHKKSDWQEIKTLTTNLIQNISEEFNVVPFPTHTLDLTEGKKFYENTCSACHGMNGDGLGSVAAELSPTPSDFQNPDYMNKATPYQFYNAITFGVSGTAMPSHQQAFTDQQRWNIAFYLMTLRKDFSAPFTKTTKQFTVKDLAANSNQALISMLKGHTDDATDGHSYQEAIDYLRAHPPQMNPTERLQFAQLKLHESLESYKTGQPHEAARLVLDAYLEGIEPIEPTLAQANYALVSNIENDFGKYRRAVKLGRPLEQVQKNFESLEASLASASSEMEPSLLDSGFLLLQSFTIILREGIEAGLLIALMIAYLVSAGYQRLRKYVWYGTSTGLGLGIILWIVTQMFITISPIQREALEGITSLLAATVLFSVSLWIIHKVDIQKWKSFIKSKAESALGTGSGFALAFAAFLAVFREVFETILFYQVLWLKGNPAKFSVVLGFILGTLALILIVVFIFKVGVRLPLKPFFTISGILLGLLAIVFAGYGIRELQNLGLLKETVLPWSFNWNLLEIHPTWEGIALQAGILFSFVFGWLSVYFEKIKNANMRLKPATVD